MDYWYRERERTQRLFDTRRCEWCGRLLLGSETGRFYVEPPMLCFRCLDRYQRQR